MATMSSGPHMNNANDVSESRWPLSRILKWAGVALILLPFAVFLIWRGTVAVDINRLRQKSIDRGEPQTPAEMGEWLPRVQPGDNAAEGLLDIWEKEEGDHWKEWRTTGKFHPERQDTPVDPDVPFVGETANTRIPWPEKEMAAARAFVASRREHDEKMRVALARPAARFPIHYAEGPMALVPHLMKVKREVMEFQVENFLAIQEGRVADSMVAMDQMARVTGVLREEPFLISQLVRIASTAITLQGVEQLVSRQPLDGRQLNQLTEILERLNLDDGLYRSLNAERTLGLSVFGSTPDQLNALGVDSFATQNGLAGNVVWSLSKYSGYLSLDRRLMMDTYDQILVLSTNMTPDRQDKILQTLTDAVAEAETFPPKLITGMHFPDLIGAGEKFMKIEAERRLWLTAVAVESYRAKHGGGLPADLADVDVPDPVNPSLKPFVGRTILLQTQTNGYQLRSVDTDRLTESPAPSGGPSDYSLRIVHHYQDADGR